MSKDKKKLMSRTQEERPSNIDVIKMQMEMMILTGIWPMKKVTIWYRMKTFLTWVTSISFITAMTIEVIVSFKQFSKISEMLTVYFSPVSYVFKLIVFSCNKNNFFEILAQLKDKRFTQYPQILDIHLKRCINESSFVVKVYQRFCWVVIVLLSVKPLFISSQSLPVELTFISKSYFYEIYAFEIAGLAISAWNNSCLDVLPVGMMSIASTQFKIIGEKLKNARKWANLTQEDINFGKTVDDEDVSDQIDAGTIRNIVDCITHHQATLEIVKSIEKVFTFCFLIQFMDSVLVICFIGFQMAHVSPASLSFMTMFLYFFTMNIQLAIYCWYGNEVMLTSSQIRDAAYNVNWSTCSPKVGKYLCIIMERTKKPSYLTAGKYAQLSLRAFAQIIQSSYSYFALIQRVYKDSY